MIKINDKRIYANFFAYDNCHKIYIIEDKEDLEQAKNCGYDILEIKDIENAYKNSCPLRFISNWKLNKQYVEQLEDNVIFEMEEK